jgi:cytochrome c biogenesis factor
VIVDVVDHGHHVATLTPALRVFAGQAVALSDVAMRSTPQRDLLVTVRQIDPPTGAATVDVTVRPLVLLVWWGGLVAAAGGGLVLLTTRTTRTVRPGWPPKPDGERTQTAVDQPSAAPVPLALEETVNRRGRRGRVRPLFPRLVFPRRG